MGTKTAPSYANIFMGQFEEQYIYPRIKNKSILYLRHIDDIFLIWTDTTDSLENFIKSINTVHPSIKFSAETSKKEINFLDTIVYIKNNRLLTKLFRKKTDRQSYLHNQSYHPSSTKKGIPYSQALRIRRICSETTDLDHNLKQLKSTLLKRGYQEKHIQSQIDKANKINREDTLKYKNKDKSTVTTPLILTYNKQHPDMRAIIDNNWNLLKIDENTSKAFVDKPTIAFRRNKNLRDIIGQTTIINNKVKRNKKPTIGLCKPCFSRPDNLCCKQVTETNQITSRYNSKTYDIYHHTNCKSSYVIYVMECIKCKIQYVGKSEAQFSLRLNNHRKDATKPSTNAIPAAQHFHDGKHFFNRDAKFTIVEALKNRMKTPSEMRQLLMKRENFWIRKLDTLSPKGLNKELNNT